MKAIKILLILLIPAMGFVGCKKSDMHRGNNTCDSSNSATEQESTVVTGKRISSETDVEADKNPDVVGSSDDDRDGGDKKKVRR